MSARSSPIRLRYVFCALQLWQVQTVRRIKASVVRCGTDRHICFRISPSRSFPNNFHWWIQCESQSKEWPYWQQRIVQRPSVQSHVLTVVISRFSRCGDTMTFRLGQRHDVQVSSPAMESDHDFPIFWGELTTFKSQLQNRYVKLPLNLHEKEEEVGGPE